MSNNLSRMGVAVLLGALLPVMAAHEAPLQEQRASVDGQSREEPEKAGDEAGQESRIDALREISVERRDEALATARRSAEELDRQIERLQEQMDDGWDRMSQAARQRSQATMVDLRRRRSTLAEWFGGMRHGSSEAWSEVRGGFVKSYHELAEALRQARARLEQDRTDRAPDAPEPDADEKSP